jgi:YD repeat-containing protein
MYDEIGRLIAVVDPGGDTVTYTYDAVGNLLEIERLRPRRCRSFPSPRPAVRWAPR